MSEVNTSGEKKVVVGAQDGDKVNVLRLQEPDPKNFGTVLTLGRTLDDEDAH